MTKKLPHQISLDDLLQALETSDENLSVEELISYKDDVPLFLSKFKLEAGKNYIKPSLLYKLYKIYSSNPLSQIEFSLSCGNFIPRNSTYFMMNISPIKLTKILNPPKNNVHLSSFSIKSHYEKFIEGAKITKGDKWFEGFMLFEIYRFYCIDHKLKKRLRYENFVTISKLYFEHRRIGSSKGNWFKLDPEVFKLITSEHEERVRKSRRLDDKDKRKRKKTQKREECDEISSIKSLLKSKKSI